MLIDAVTMKGAYVTVVIPLLLLKKCRNAGFDCDIIIRERTEDEIMAYAAEYTEHNTTGILLVKNIAITVVPNYDSCSRIWSNLLILNFLVCLAALFNKLRRSLV